MTGEQRIYDFLEQLSSKAPVPGGGGAAALGGALGTALGQMVGNLTVGKKRYADVEEEIRQVMVRLNVLQMELTALADEDARVFAPLAKAYGMPTETKEEKQKKEKELEACLEQASLVPIQVMERAEETFGLFELLEEKGSVMAVSDVGVGVQLARAALLGAAMNVYINTKSMKDRNRARELNEQTERLIQQGTAKADRIYEKVLEKLIQQR